VNGSSGTTTQYGDLATLIEWNTEDPVDDFEKQRNNRIEEYQGNRNPFIDHPEYASKIYS
ncbi:MAG: endonuclease, partial [Coprobacillus sp.]|nr:endonuclease [Coprobacillus sp.]